MHMRQRERLHAKVGMQIPYGAIDANLGSPLLGQASCARQIGDFLERALIRLLVVAPVIVEEDLVPMAGEVMYENEYSKNSYDGLPGNIPRGTCVAWTDPCHLRLGIKADIFARQV